MKIFHFSVIIVLCTGVFLSCQVIQCGADKDAFLSKYDQFIERVDRLDLEVSDKGWEKYDRQFKQYIEDCYDQYEKDLSMRERRRFWMKTLKYYATRYGEGMLNELSKKDGISERAGRNIEEALNTTGRELEDFVNKTLGEIEDLVKSAGKDIEDWAAKIQGILQE
jgi:hypothetical protein